jgi:YVTN family beta-propeller protein
MDSLTNRVYVSSSSGTVSVIDGITNSVIATVEVGFLPSGLGVDSIAQQVYVANPVTNHVSVLDGVSNTVVATVPVGFHPFSATTNPLLGRAYVTNLFSDSVSVIDGASNTLVATVGVGVEPSELATNSYANLVYVVHAQAGMISVIVDPTGPPAIQRTGERRPASCLGSSSGCSPGPNRPIPRR